MRALNNLPALQKTQAKTLLGTVALTTALCAPLNASAGWLGDMFSETAALNAGGGGAHQGQSMNLYTGGSATLRVAQKQYNIVNFAPPRLSAGCGGIDAFTGSFSHINGPGFVAALKNIGQAAAGQAFMLALKTLAPEVGEVMQWAQGVANEINGANINACEAGKSLVEGTLGKWATENQRNAALWSRELNREPDYASAKYKTSGSETETEDAIAAAKTTLPGVKPEGTNRSSPLITEGNVVWKALSNRMNGLTGEQKLILMSLTGTVVFKKGPDAIVPYQPIINDLAVFMGGGLGPINTVTIWKCLDGYNDDQCRDMTTQDVPIEGFKFIIKDAMRRIQSTIEARAFTPTADIAFAEQVNIPIQRMLAIGVVARTPAIAATLTDRYEDIMAAEFSAAFIKQALDIVQQALSAAKSTASQIEIDELKSLAETSNELRRQVGAQLRTAYAKSMQLTNVASEIDQIEKTMYASMPSSLAPAVNFGKSKSLQ